MGSAIVFQLIGSFALYMDQTKAHVIYVTTNGHQNQNSPWKKQKNKTAL